MKNCTDCKYANWRRTTAGKLHPSGDGKCEYPWKMPALPAAFYWISGNSPCGGGVNRKQDNNEHCSYFARIDAALKAQNG